MRRRLYRNQDYCYHLDAGLHGLGVGLHGLGVGLHGLGVGLHGLGVGVVAAVVECTAVVGLVVVDAAAASDASVAFAEVDAVVVGLAAEHAALAFVVFEAELVLVFEIVAAGDD